MEIGQKVTIVKMPSGHHYALPLQTERSIEGIMAKLPEGSQLTSLSCDILEEFTGRFGSLNYYEGFPYERLYGVNPDGVGLGFITRESDALLKLLGCDQPCV